MVSCHFFPCFWLKKNMNRTYPSYPSPSACGQSGRSGAHNGHLRLGSTGHATATHQGWRKPRRPGIARQRNTQLVSFLKPWLHGYGHIQHICCFTGKKSARKQLVLTQLVGAKLEPSDGNSSCPRQDTKAKKWNTVCACPSIFCTRIIPNYNTNPKASPAAAPDAHMVFAWFGERAMSHQPSFGASNLNILSHTVHIRHYNTSLGNRVSVSQDDESQRGDPHQ